MKWAKLRQILHRCFLFLLLLGVSIIGVAFLPGDVEGNYRGIASSCGCDGITFINLRKGKMLTYDSAHPPSWLTGWYQKTDDGVELYLHGLRYNEGDKFLMRAYPRLLITKFVSSSEGKEYWCWKWPAIGRIGESLKTQDVSAMHIGEDGVTKRDVFDCDLKLIRSEIKTGPNQWVEQAAPLQSSPFSFDGFF